ncbi:flavin reductase family protein [Subtercola frigoramans]|uniref:Flavin reductase (DIM6/NTAB) family NADH-FMN oxidoreductase RutF n=1 Tax=Subtercola frigoramans TaxID=120298 RepID=A0ABS2L1A3_9MICO|nr:flavin reductase family protein [Subtercola frigoramans]MBM7470863.1 flavin reductase (DIM6/NTAB) family NADH-FMN oxidoreductase RutF [Subtercola frigoramans]
MITLQQTIDRDQLRRAFGSFPSGIAAICAYIDGKPAGMAASSFTWVSLDPPLVSVCIQNESTTWPTLRQRPRLGLSVLSQWHDQASRQLSIKDGDRFAGVEWDAGPDNSVLIRGATAWMEVSMFQEVPAGDHVIAILQVHRFDWVPNTPPLVYYGNKFRKISMTAEEELHATAEQW